MSKKRLMLICGEPSGDALGGQLMAAIRQLNPDVEMTGVGGRAMQAQGLKSLFGLETMAVMGLAEVVPAIPAILRRVQDATQFALQTRPDAVVLIDSPDFTHRIARALKKTDPSIRTVNYVAPQVWASRPWRAKAMAKYFDLVLALFPFEVPFFEKYGLKSRFVGHPVIERTKAMTGGDALRARLGISKDAPLLVMLPGSRTSEIRLMFPTFRATVEKLAQRIPGLITILPTVPHVAGRVREKTENWPTALFIIEGEADKFASFDAADVAFAASGTVTAEIALSRTPMVVFYRLGWLTHALAIWFYISRFFTLINVVLDRMAVPELFQQHATPEALAGELEKLFKDQGARAAQISAMDEFAQSMGEGEEAPSLRAARVLLDFVGAK